MLFSDQEVIKISAHLLPRAQVQGLIYLCFNWLLISNLYKYRAAYNQNKHLKHIADNLVPFAVEATGILGDKASKFVNGLAKLQGAIPEADPRIGWARRFFLNRVSVLCAKSRAELVMLSQNTQLMLVELLEVYVSLQGNLEFEQILYDNLRGPPVRPSQASAHCNRSV
jgi:hypothetical protein